MVDKRLAAIGVNFVVAKVVRAYELWEAEDVRQREARKLEKQQQLAERQAIAELESEQARILAQAETL